MPMRAGRINRRAVIGHPVIRRRVQDDDASVIAEAIERRQSPRTATPDVAPSGAPKAAPPGAPKAAPPGAPKAPPTDTDSGGGR